MAGHSEAVAVIGAGGSGLAACKALADRGIEFVCFEAGDDVGGNWYLGNPSGRSAAYRSLHSVGSRKVSGFHEYPFPEGGPDFPDHERMHAYLRNYADAFGLRACIEFSKEVKWAERQKGGGWRLSVSGEEAPRHFEALIVASGHHWDPEYPDPPFPGSFSGEVVHAHDYVDPSDPVELRGKRVLVVGIGNSGADLTCELSRKGVARRVMISSRRGAWIMPKYALGRPFDTIAKVIPWAPLAPQRWGAGLAVRLLSGDPRRFGLPAPDHRFLEAHPTISEELLLRLGSGDAVAKPGVEELCGDSVRFSDGSVEEVEAIVYATGYRVSLPFFDPELISAPGNVLGLYKRIFKPDIDDLAFVAMGNALPSTLRFAEAQSKLIAMWLEGEWAPPKEAEMRSAIAADDQRFTGHLTPGARHTMEVWGPVYERDLRRKVIPAGRRRALRPSWRSPLERAGADRGKVGTAEAR